MPAANTTCESVVLIWPSSRVPRFSRGGWFPAFDPRMSAEARYTQFSGQAKRYCTRLDGRIESVYLQNVRRFGPQV